MEKLVISRGVVIFYITAMFLAYLVMIRVDSLDNNIATDDNKIVYVKE